MVAMLQSAQRADDATTDEPVSAPLHHSRTMVTTEGRMQRAGIGSSERNALRRTIGRVVRDVGADAGMAVRRSVEIHAELRRVLGSDVPART